jgi:hypothetical protein
MSSTHSYIGLFPTAVGKNQTTQQLSNPTPHQRAHKFASDLRIYFLDCSHAAENDHHPWHYRQAGKEPIPTITDAAKLD